MKKAPFFYSAIVCIGLIATLTQGELIHRYSFSEGSGTDVLDSISAANGVLRGAGASWNTGTLSLPGGPSATQAYVDLPNGLVSGLVDVTFEGWFRNDGLQGWGRVFDFGSGTAGELTGPGGAADGLDYILLAANRGTDVNTQRIEFRNEDPAGGGIVTLDANAVDAGEYHFAVVYDADGNAGAPQFTWYRDNVVQGTLNTDDQLSEINDVNNWLGRSNWTGDANVQGTYNEFRIWDTALNDVNVAASFALGPDAVIPEPSSSSLIFVGLSLLLLLKRIKR